MLPARQPPSFLSRCLIPPVCAAALALLAGCPDSGGSDPTPDLTPTSEVVQTFPTLEMDATSLAFGEVAVGEAATGDFLIGNSGDAPLEVSVALSDDAGGTLSLLSPQVAIEVDPGGTASLSVRFAPDAIGPVEGELTLHTNDEKALQVAVAVTGAGAAPDGDGDGFVEGEDCDDGNADINPDAVEVCDGVDNDCDGEADVNAEGVSVYALDADDDGYGDPDATVSACEAPPGYVGNSDDCDDTDGAIHPEAVEICDGVDNNCDAEVDNNVSDAPAYYEDADGDGFGVGEATLACEAPGGMAPFDGDCDDTRAEVSPEGDEVCDGVDNNCNGEVDEGLTIPLYADSDGDTHGDASSPLASCTGSQPGYVDNSGDCDDGDATRYPGAQERCDGDDEDCDDSVDEAAVDMSVFYADGDSDGYGLAEDAVTACVAPEGYAPEAGDCDDTSAEFNPGAAEDDCADPNDYNCDGSTAYDDADGDGYPACQDCDDQDAAIHPDADEACDQGDNDCDGQVDEGVTTTFYLDADSDGHGDGDSPVEACTQPEGTAVAAGDCNDLSAAANPGAAETCDGQDTDCDGEADEDDALGCIDLYLDEDGDTFGGADTLCSCEPRLGYTTRPGDCDDAAPAINPGALERCDTIDNDCDAATDEVNAHGCLRYYDDEDLDGWGDTQDYLCLCQPEDTYTSTANGDCNDLDAESFPGNLEACDTKDNNCNGQVDEGVTTTWYVDGDGDGHGASYSTIDACVAPDGHVATGGDCNDFNPAIYPGRLESCDEIDNNCNGQIDEDLPEVTVYVDLDGDGHGAETTSGKLSCLIDSDGDGEGDTAPDGYALSHDDCDDSASVVFPGAPELCDGRLNNCNLTVPDIQCPTLCEGEWPVFVGGSAGYPLIAQLDGDNQLEVVVQNEGQVRVISHEGEVQWQASVGVSYSYPTLADFNYDDTMDVIVGAHGGTTHIFDGATGNSLAAISTGSNAGYYGAVAIDVDGDGATDLIPTGSQPYQLIYMNRDLTVREQVALSPLEGERFWLNSPNLYDFEGDGVAEIGMGSGSWQCRGEPETCLGRYYVFNADGSYYNDPTWSDPSKPWFEVPGYPYSYAGEGVWGITADADGDGREELSMYFTDYDDGPSQSWIWDQDGVAMPESGIGWNTSNPILAPIDANGELDLSGALHNAGGPVVDIDGDGIYEVIKGAGGGLSVTRGGVPLDGYPISLNGRSVIGDLNRDGRLDILFLSGSNNALNCYTMGEGSYDEMSVLSHGTVDGLGRNWYTTGRLDPYEPNDRRGVGFDPASSTSPVSDSRAFDMGALRDTFASGNGWYRSLKGLIAEQDDVDYYVMRGSIIRVQLQILVNDYDVYLHQFRPDGTFINTMSSTNAGTAAENITCHTTTSCLETGTSKTFIIEVRGKDPTVDFGPFPYRLSTIWAN